MLPKLYGDVRSPCVRAVLLAANELNVKLEYVAIDILKQEHLSDNYLKLNPRHTVPTLDDNGFIVWDSHAIMIYLCDTYGDNDPIYPKDGQERAIINQMLYFETGDIFPFDRLISGPIIVNGQKEVPQDLAQQLEKGYGFLNAFLARSKYVAGDNMTIADFSFWTTLSNAEIFVPIDEKKYPKLVEWLKHMNNMPFKQINETGRSQFFDLVKHLF